MENLEFKEQDATIVFKIAPRHFAPPPLEVNYVVGKPKRYGESVPVRTEPKINRNSPCPCGSGNKFKKCCLSQK